MRQDQDANRPNTVSHGTTNTLGTASAGRLTRLEDLDDLKIAEGEPDIRGWDVRGADGRKLGKVADLLVDTGVMRVRYIEVKLEEDVAEQARRAAGEADQRTEATRYRLVPIGAARLDDRDDDVMLDAGATTEFAGVPAYDHDRRDAPTREHEAELMRRYGYVTDDGALDEFYAGRQFDDRSFLGRRRQGPDDASYLSRVRT